ncbi:hypothetical protein MD484_g468, partial [Candolleomyces efflorescens]
MKLSTSFAIIALASLQGLVFAAPPGLSTLPKLSALPKPIKNPGIDLLSHLKFRRQVDLALGEDTVDPTPTEPPVEAPAEATPTVTDIGAIGGDPNVPSDANIPVEVVEVADSKKAPPVVPPVTWVGLDLVDKFWAPIRNVDFELPAPVQNLHLDDLEVSLRQN